MNLEFLKLGRICIFLHFSIEIPSMQFISEKKSSTTAVPMKRTTFVLIRFA